MALANVALTDTFDIWRVRTNQLIVYSSQVDDKVNTAYELANSSYDSSNAGYVVSNSAFDKTNLVFTTVNAAFTQSNTDNVRLTSAYISSNGCWDRSNGVYELININFDTTNAVYNISNAEYARVNGLYSLANSLYDFANSATDNTFTQIFVDITALENKTDSLYGVANSGYNKTNLVFTTVNAAYTMANMNYTVTNAAYVMANANYTVTNSAFARANAALPNTTSTYDGTMTITGNLGIGVAGSSAFRADISGDARATGNIILNSISTNDITVHGRRINLPNNMVFGSATANAIFIDTLNSRVGIGNTNPTANLYVAGTANVVGTMFVNGVNVAPTITSSYVSTNLAFTTVNAAYTMANSNYTISNNAYNLANANFTRLTAAFDRANNTVLASGGSFTGDLYLYRSATPSTGYLFLNQAGTRYVGFDGSNYIMPSTNLYVNGGLVWHSGNDGAGSGLDADLLDGLNQTTAASGSTICARDGNGDSNFRYVNGAYVNTSDDVNGGNITHIVAKFGDNYHRSATAAKVAAFLSGQSMNIVGNATTAGNITAYTINQNVGTGNSPSFASVYADVFYDSSDAGNYYVNSSSISFMNDIRAFIYYERDNTGYYFGSGSGDCRFRNVYADYFESYGSIYAASNITAYSDGRLKKNLQKITDWRDILNGINGYRYEWNELGERVVSDSLKTGIQIGLVAQELEKVLPQATDIQMMQYANIIDGVRIPKSNIDYDPENPYKAVKEEVLVPVLVEAIKGLMAELDEVKAEIKALKGQ